ncbi:CASP-like protein 4B1 [Telopea speciosissima]|uniref:CASP-like protein 4B1 n=1 Tax=Telopea speciosissima TaxID=54955 RepID=UPI001CC63F96|nr:CASP-like protein 4B1 [Telopea speciosissima]
MNPTKEMENSQDHTPMKPETAPPLPPPDIENQSSSYTLVHQRRRREDLLKKGQVVLRTICSLFSFISFVIMATNNHRVSGNIYDNNFHHYEQYRYLLAIGIISTVYTIAQVLRQIHEFSTGKYLFSQLGLNFLDFFGDQIIAYLLVSGASSAVPLTNLARKQRDNVLADPAAASISMAILAFVALAMSALISGFKLSIFTEKYI